MSGGSLVFLGVLIAVFALVYGAAGRTWFANHERMVEPELFALKFWLMVLAALALAGYGGALIFGFVTP